MKRLVPTLLLVPATALAGSAFDGTWKSNLESVKTTGKPDVYLLADGEYTCSSCSPELKVKADGAEHKVSGHAYYDTVMVKVTEAHRPGACRLASCFRVVAGADIQRR